MIDVFHAVFFLLKSCLEFVSLTSSWILNLLLYLLNFLSNKFTVVNLLGFINVFFSNLYLPPMNLVSTPLALFLSEFVTLLGYYCRCNLLIPNVVWQCCELNHRLTLPFTDGKVSVFVVILVRILWHAG